MAILLTRLAGFRLTEALALSCNEAETWLACAVEAEKLLRAGECHM